MSADDTDPGPCRCWIDERPTPYHPEHCCMREDGQTCHQKEGMAAFNAAEMRKAAFNDPEGHALVQAIHDRKAGQ